jgi:hypothetical protein
MHFHRIKTTVVENQALGRARKRRAQQLLRKARRMTRRSLTDDDYVMFGRLDGPNAIKKGVGRNTHEDVKMMARQARDLLRPDPDCPQKRLGTAERIRSHALDVRDRGSIGRRYLHLVYCYLRGRTYREVEKKTEQCPAPSKIHPGRVGPTNIMVEVNKPDVANVVRAVRKEWGLTDKEMPTETQIAMWVEKGNLDRTEVCLMLMIAEENKALDKMNLKTARRGSSQEEHVHVRAV